MRNGIHGIRVSISHVNADGTEVLKRGGMYDVDFESAETQDVSNQQVADMFAEVVRSSVLYDLTTENGEGN